MGELLRFALARVLPLSLLITSCSFVLDTKQTQCSVDADCAHFSNEENGHVTCQSGVCQKSAMGPWNCFPGDPETQTQFATQCTTADAIPFDNCKKLGLCDVGSLAAAMRMSLTPLELGTDPGSTVIPKPTINCVDASPNVIYVTGSTNLPPLLKAVQPLLDADTIPFTVVFAPQTSCKGADAIYSTDSTKHLIKDVTNNWAFYYKKDASDPKKYNQTYCLLDPLGNTVDVGESDIYPESCNTAYSRNTPGIGDYVGPVQAITFVVPARSTQIAISAEAAHLVFAAGSNAGQVSPWTDPHLYFIRSSGTGTVQLLSRAIDVAPMSWWGIDRLSATSLVQQLKTVVQNNAEQAIGILSSDFADNERSNLRVLAFQQKNQDFGYLPDSSAESFDKANVRDGHYPIWGAIHLMAATVNGSPASEAARALILQFTEPKLEETLVRAIIDAGFIPQCAMKVTHDAEVGPLKSSFLDKGFVACGCVFDQQKAGSTSCQACQTSSSCPASAPSCNYGYCEKQ
jgi:hypothetical protein